MSLPQTLLITGGAGFLGAACAQALLAQGHRVRALDIDFSAGRLPEHPALERICGSVCDEATVANAVSGVDRVLHLAAIADVHRYIEDPLSVLDTNLLGTRALLLAAKREGVPIVFASTSEVYGKSPDDLEEWGDSLYGPTTSPRWSYATSKRAAEHYAWALAGQGLTVAAVRYFNVYGPGLDSPGKGRVISTFLGQLQQRKPLHLVDGGEAIRCFCYIDDAVRATLQLLLHLAPQTPLAGRPFNIGNPEPVTMRELATRMCALAGRPPHTLDVSGQAHFGAGFEEIPRRIPDVSAARDLLGFTATIDLDTGLARTLAAHSLLAETPHPQHPDKIEVIRPHYATSAALFRALRASLLSGHTSNDGPQVRAFEAELGQWFEAEDVISMRSGAAGLEVALLALQASGKAALPSFTYVASLNAIERAGLTPVFIDIDPETWTLDPAALARAFEQHPDISVVMPVCAFGIPPDLDAITTLAHAAGARVLYDAAHAFGTMVDGSRWPRGVDLSVYSFHATKVLPTTEGGAIVTPYPDLAQALRHARAHGLDTGDVLASKTGTNAKLDELSAAIGRENLGQIDAILTSRRAFWVRLRGALKNRGWGLQHVPEGVAVNGQNLCARSPDPLLSTVHRLEALQISTRRYFYPPLHTLARCRAFACEPAELPVTSAVAASNLCLPLHTQMSEHTLARLEAAF